MKGIFSDETGLPTDGRVSLLVKLESKIVERSVGLTAATMTGGRPNGLSGSENPNDCEETSHPLARSKGHKQRRRRQSLPTTLPRLSSTSTQTVWLCLKVPVSILATKGDLRYKATP